MKNKILIVDDSNFNRELLHDILSDDYEILMAEDGIIAKQIIEEKQSEIKVILLDLMMPRMNGIELLQYLKQYSWFNKIGIIIISSEDTVSIEVQCFELGVTDFIHRPFNDRLVKKRVDNVCSLFDIQNNLENTVRIQTQDLIEKNAQLARSKENVIDILGTMVEYRNFESGEHVKRVKKYTKILADSMMKHYPEYHLDDHKVEMIVSASALHDIGKIAFSDAILLKPGKLTDEEFEIMKTHTTKGTEIINNINDVWEDDYGQIAKQICEYHHERYDGNGYPEKLVGDMIPISAQIVALADVYDSLTHERIYKKAIDKNKAFEMIMNDECGVFSDKVKFCLIKIREEFEKI